MEAKSKAETFIGFSMRSGKYKIGANACLTLKRASLIIVCKSASENSVKDALKLARRFHCKVVKTSQRLLFDYTHRENAKIMAICDNNFANLILENLENEFILIG